MKLPTLPFLPQVACKYCQQMEKWNKDHESELRDKATKLCRKSDSSHIHDFLSAFLDRTDHSDLGPKRQIEIVNAIHELTGCDCLDPKINLITDMITNQSQSMINSTSTSSMITNQSQSSMINKAHPNPTSVMITKPAANPISVMIAKKNLAARAIAPRSSSTLHQHTP